MYIYYADPKKSTTQLKICVKAKRTKRHAEDFALTFTRIKIRVKCPKWPAAASSPRVHTILFCLSDFWSTVRFDNGQTGSIICKPKHI